MLFEVRRCRAAVALLTMAAVGFVVAAATRHGLLPIADGAQPLVERGSWLAGYVLLVVMLLVYANRVRAEIEGRIALRPAERKLAQEEKAGDRDPPRRFAAGTSAEAGPYGSRQRARAQPSGAGEDSDAPAEFRGGVERFVGSSPSVARRTSPHAPRRQRSARRGVRQIELTARCLRRHESNTAREPTSLQVGSQVALWAAEDAEWLRRPGSRCGRPFPSWPASRWRSNRRPPHAVGASAGRGECFEPGAVGKYRRLLGDHAGVQQPGDCGRGPDRAQFAAPPRDLLRLRAGQLREALMTT